VAAAKMAAVLQVQEAAAQAILLLR